MLYWIIYIYRLQVKCYLLNECIQYPCSVLHNVWLAWVAVIKWKAWVWWGVFVSLLTQEANNPQSSNHGVKISTEQQKKSSFFRCVLLWRPRPYCPRLDYALSLLALFLFHPSSSSLPLSSSSPRVPGSSYLLPLTD